MPCPGRVGCGVDLVAAGVGADHDRPLVLDEPFGGVEVGRRPSRVRRSWRGRRRPRPRTGRCRCGPAPRRPARGARPPRRACLAGPSWRSTCVPGRASTFLKPATSMSTPRAMIGGIVGRVALARAPVAPPVRLLESVVPVEVQAGRDVGQPVDLRRHVVGDEQCRRMPVDMVGVLSSAGGASGSFIRCTPSGLRNVMISPGLWPATCSCGGCRSCPGRRPRRGSPAPAPPPGTGSTGR